MKSPVLCMQDRGFIVFGVQERCSREYPVTGMTSFVVSPRIPIFPPYL